MAASSKYKLRLSSKSGMIANATIYYNTKPPSQAHEQKMAAMIMGQPQSLAKRRQ